MSDWQAVLGEAREVLTSGGLLFHEWGNGQSDEAWVQIREKTRALFQGAGVEKPFHPGARKEAEVNCLLTELGLWRSAELVVGPGPDVTLRDSLRRIASGELSYVWNVPKPVQESCLPLLQNWCEERFDLERPVPIPREIHWTIYRNEAAWQRMDISSNP